MCSSTVSSNLAKAVSLTSADASFGSYVARAVDASRARRGTSCLAVPSFAPRPISTPMLRAVPSTILIAASTSLALRSFILASAICLTCARLSLPTFSRFWAGLPFSIPRALRMRSEAGDVFRTKLKERSSKTVISTGMMLPASRPSFVVLFAERHDVGAVLTERRADRGRRRGLPGLELEFDDCSYFLCHWSLLSHLLRASR